MQSLNFWDLFCLIFEWFQDFLAQRVLGECTSHHVFWYNCLHWLLWSTFIIEVPVNTFAISNCLKYTVRNHSTTHQNLMLSCAQFHIFEQGKGKNQTRPHRHHLQDNIAMFYFLNIVSYIKAKYSTTLFIKSVSILSLIADIIFSQLEK